MPLFLCIFVHCRGPWIQRTRADEFKLITLHAYASPDLRASESAPRLLWLHLSRRKDLRICCFDCQRTKDGGWCVRSFPMSPDSWLPLVWVDEDCSGLLGLVRVSVWLSLLIGSFCLVLFRVGGVLVWWCFRSGMAWDVCSAYYVFLV